jgi:hypothetical protein
MPTKHPAKSENPSVEAKSVSKPVEKLAVTLRTDVGFEYHLDLPRPLVEGIIDPAVPDQFIEVPCTLHGTKRFLHTAYIKECDVRGL